MAVIRNPSEGNSRVDYVATFAVFGCVAILITMLKFLGFKAILNFNTPQKEDHTEITALSMTGAYRANSGEFFDSSDRISGPPKVTTSSIRPPPSSDPNVPLRKHKSASDLTKHKSTSDLTKQKNLPAHVSKSTNDVSNDPRGPSSSNPNRNTTIVVDEKNNAKTKKDQLRLEKKRLAEQKAREKAQAQAKAKETKLRKEREKQAAREQAKERERQIAREKAEAKSKKKAAQPAPPMPATATVPPAPPMPATATVPHAPPQPQNIPKATKPGPAYSSNTLQSSISTTSGPPPYAESNEDIVSASTDNVTFRKPAPAANSWDLVAQHRQQMASKPVAQARPKAGKTMVMDLQYNLGAENSDA